MTKTTATTKTKTKTWKKCLCNPHVWGLVARVRTTAERAHCRAAQEHRRPNPTPCGCPMTMCIFCIQTDMSTCLCQSTVELNHATTYIHCNKHTPDSTLLLCLSRGASGGIEPTPSPKRLVFKSVIKKPTSSTSLPSLRLRGSSSSTSLLSARCHLIQVCYLLGQEEEEDPRHQL